MTAICARCKIPIGGNRGANIEHMVIVSAVKLKEGGEFGITYCTPYCAINDLLELEGKEPIRA